MISKTFDHQIAVYNILHVNNVLRHYHLKKIKNCNLYEDQNQSYHDRNEIQNWGLTEG